MQKWTEPRATDHQYYLIISNSRLKMEKAKKKKANAITGNLKLVRSGLRIGCLSAVWHTEEISVTTPSKSSVSSDVTTRFCPRVSICS